MEIDNSVKKLLQELYYNENKKFGLRGIQPLYRAAKKRNPDITIRIIKKWLR